MDASHISPDIRARIADRIVRGPFGQHINFVLEPLNGARTRGATVGLNVSYLEPGQTADLLGKATVVRRGRAICIVEVDVVDTDQRHIARGIVTYRLRQATEQAGGERSVLGEG